MPRLNHRRRGAFTLMEVLLVLVILVILGSIAVGVFRSTRQKANIDAVKAQIGQLKTPIGLYETHTSQLPQRLEDLMAEPQQLAGLNKWAGPYLDRVPIDPWGNALLYVSPSQRNSLEGYDVWSAGPNGVAGDDDDIGNW